MRVDVEVGGQAEVPLAAGGEADVAADPRDAERANRPAIEIVSDHVPDALVEPERVGVEAALGDAVTQRRPVAELDRALLRDPGLELGEATRELRRVVGRADAHALRRVGRRVLEAGPAEGEILQREPQWLGVRELALEVVERRLQGGELVVVEIESVEEVVLRPQACRALRR